MTKRRNVIVYIGTSTDGYIARPDGDLEWLTSRPAPEGFYGRTIVNWTESIDDLAFTSATITVEQPPGTVVLTISCTFSAPTSDGGVSRQSVTCSSS